MNRRTLRVTAVALAAASALAAVASSVLATRAAVNPTNIAATRTYLRARPRYEQAIKGGGRAAQASARAFAGQVGNECPNVLAGAPRGRATEEIAREVHG